MHHHQSVTSIPMSNAPTLHQCCSAFLGQYLKSKWWGWSGHEYISSFAPGMNTWSNRYSMNWLAMHQRSFVALNIAIGAAGLWYIVTPNGAAATLSLAICSLKKSLSL